jgi:hypothetical protein
MGEKEPAVNVAIQGARCLYYLHFRHCRTKIRAAVHVLSDSFNSVPTHCFKL